MAAMAMMSAPVQGKSQINVATLRRTLTRDQNFGVVWKSFKVWVRHKPKFYKGRKLDE
jgi:hypothetical protein